MMIMMGLVGSAFAQGPPNPLGDWKGTLKVGGIELRLVLHISKAEDGSLKAAIDSIDQPGGNGIPVSSISLKGQKLTFTSEKIHASYEGHLNAEGTAIQGTFTQVQPLPLDFTRVVATVKTEQQPAKPSDIDGTWIGKINAGAITLRIVFHIANTAQGLTATMDSPDQNANGLAVTSVTRNGQSITFEMKQMAAQVEGKLNAGLTAIDGTFEQRGVRQPFVLKRAKNASEGERRRPQNPIPPYPYRSEDVEYPNPAAGIKLAATLTIPRGTGPFPAAVLITGSGPQDRDEALLGHKPFLVLSDYLTRKGIAVLRTDDRGVSKSGGVFGTATTADFSTDTEAGVAYLKTRSEVNPHKIGLIGHSEGGVIAPMVAARNPDIAFVVMMAGSGVPGDQIIAEQVLLISEASGESKQAAEKAAEQERQVLAIAKQKDPGGMREKLKEILGGDETNAQLDAKIQQLTSPWFQYFITYDPGPALEKVKCPVLAINGAKDLQVPPAQNLPAIRKALEAGGNKNMEVEELPGLNHLFQTARTGAPDEYADIEETISPIALEKMASWILKQTAEPAGRPE
jgi:fermentation-respiration switch protein FrsA (DUF1100 family)